MKQRTISLGWKPVLRFVCHAFLFSILPVSASLHGQTRSLEFRYQNPILSEPVRDPQITKIGNTWYMTATSSPFFEPTRHGDLPRVKIWSSKDLNHWEVETSAIHPSAKHWYRKYFWAPELFPYRGKWYLTFNCPAHGDNGPQSVGLAVADEITGPFLVLTEDKPLIEGNDATLFEDGDGKVYLFRSGISAVQVDLQNARTVGAPFDVVQPGGNGAWDGTSTGAPSVNLEGPSVLKHGSTYYLLYASWGRGYEEGYATAPKITGPWIKYPGNPIYGAQDQEWSRRFKHVYTQSPEVPYTQVGHGSPFIGPDGTVWFSCHGYLKGKGQEPHLIITPLRFDDAGILHMRLTWTLQKVTLSRQFHLNLGTTRLATLQLNRLAREP